MTDRGAGAPLVVIPGIQGRWEWMLPAVDALAARCRVITGSLPGDAGSIADSDPAAGFERHTAWLDALLDRAGVRGGVSLCGVSYGGWIALHYAAVRPTRVRTLTLVSTPSPSWQPGCRVDRYLAAPRLMSPVFALGSSFRLYPEIAAAFPPLGARSRFIARHLLRVARHPLAPTRMASRSPPRSSPASRPSTTSWQSTARGSTCGRSRARGTIGSSARDTWGSSRAPNASPTS
jgi:pimeloyl-ACP methyl ester carboxylesterase